MMDSDSENPCVWVVILNFNGQDYLQDCVRSLQATDYAALHILIVDNASEDDSTADATDLRLRLGTLYAETLDQDDRARPLFEEAFEQIDATDRLANPLAELYDTVAQALGQGEHGRETL